MKTPTNPSFQDVVNKSKRANDEANNKLHWFSSKFSVYLSYFLIRIGVSADQATILFFLIGLTGSLLYVSVSPFITLLGYLFWRLHIIIDMSDGDIARFNRTFSIRGSYWDAVIHSVINPLYYIFSCFSFYLQFDNNMFIIIGAFLGLTSSVLMGVKNNYFKAMLYNGLSLKSDTSSIPSLKKSFKENVKSKIIYFLSEILSIEGFVFLTVFVKFFDIELIAFILVFIYFFSNILIMAIKFYQLSYTGKTYTKT